MDIAQISLAIPHETEAGEAVLVRIEVWRLGATLASEPEVECFRLPPRAVICDRITESDFREAVDAAR